MTEILFEDKWIVVCLKPAGVLSEEGGMPELLREACGVERIYPVHRLDRAVSGVMVYAKDGKTAAKLSAAMAERTAEKRYLAVVEGCPENINGVYIDLLYHDAQKNKSYVVKRMRRGVREAELEYEVLETSGELTLVSVKLHTGRSHQIRVQFSSRGMPLAGDVKYGSRHKDCGIALFSESLRFPHPVTGKTVAVSHAAPEGFPWDGFIHT